MNKLDENMMPILPELTEKEINILLFAADHLVHVISSANVGAWEFLKPIDIRQLAVMKRKDAINRIAGGLGGLINERRALAKKIEHLP